MKKIFEYSIIVFLLMFSSCLKENIPLSNSREDYLGDQLRIDGFYHQITKDGYIVNAVFYYRNGILFQILIHSEFSNPADFVSLLTKERIELYRKGKYNWGIFKIKGNEFLSEHWETPTQGNYLATITRAGEILSDTSYVITKYINSQRGLAGGGDSYWYFYPFSPKPDSTNVFIK